MTSQASKILEEVKKAYFNHVFDAMTTRSGKPKSPLVDCSRVGLQAETIAEGFFTGPPQDPEESKECVPKALSELFPDLPGSAAFGMLAVVDWAGLQGLLFEYLCSYHQPTTQEHLEDLQADAIDHMGWIVEQAIASYKTSLLDQSILNSSGDV